MSILEKPLAGTITGYEAVTTTRGRVLLPGTAANDFLNIILAYDDKYQLSRLEELAVNLYGHIADHNNPHEMGPENILGSIFEPLYKEWVKNGYKGSIADMVTIIFRYMNIINTREPMDEGTSDTAVPSVNIFDYAYRVKHNEAVGPDVHGELVEELFGGDDIQQEFAYAMDLTVALPPNSTFVRGNTIDVIGENMAFKKSKFHTLDVDYTEKEGFLSVSEGYQNYANDDFNDESWIKEGLGIVGDKFREFTEEGLHLVGHKVTLPEAQSHKVSFYLTSYQAGSFVILDWVESLNQWDPVAVTDGVTIIPIKEGYDVNLTKVSNRNYVDINCTACTEKSIGYAVATIDGEGNLSHAGTGRYFRIEKFGIYNTLAKVPYVKDFATDSSLVIDLRNKLPSVSGTIHIRRDLPCAKFLETKELHVFKLVNAKETVNLYHVNGSFILKYSDSVNPDKMYAFSGIPLMGDSLFVSIRYDEKKLILNVNGTKRETDIDFNFPEDAMLKLDKTFNGRMKKVTVLEKSATDRGLKLLEL
jgi:hypothetical protein